MPTEPRQPASPKTPIDVAERLAARGSACAGAVTAFALFCMTWLTSYAWLTDDASEGKPARRDVATDGETSSSRHRGPTQIAESKDDQTRRRGVAFESRERTGLSRPGGHGLEFRSTNWQDKSFFTHATSERYLVDRSAVQMSPPGIPHTLSFEPGTLDPALPPPQTPVPLDEQPEESAPGTAYGVIVRFPTPGMSLAPATEVEAAGEESGTAFSGSTNATAPRFEVLPPPPDEIPSGLPAQDASGTFDFGVSGSDDETADASASDPIDDEPLPSLEDELAKYAGGQMGRSLIDPEHDTRLPREGDPNPQPVTAFQKFLGNDASCPGGNSNSLLFENGKWGESGFTHERRLTIYGQYQVFGLAFEEAGDRFDGIGNFATFEVDFRLTGTERLHVQFQPLGRNDQGGSFRKLNGPRGYLDNSTVIPERFWFEGELYSLFSDDIDDQFTPRDWHFVAGKFPFVLHNQLLLNDEILGVAVNSNTNMPGSLSNLNVQFFGGRDDTAPFDFRSTIAGVHASLDYRARFYELTYAYQWDNNGTLIDSDYLAASSTRFFGPVTLATRAMGRFDQAGGSSGLFVGEANWTRTLHDNALESEFLVAYLTGFHATSRWQSIGGGDFDRLRSNFAVNPLVSISQRGTQSDVSGAALGVQIFRHHENESWTPEISCENRDTGQVWAAGITFQRKLSRRWFMELSGVRTWTNDPTLRDRTGLLLSTTWLL